MGASSCGSGSWEWLPAASSCSFLQQQQKLAPMGRSYGDDDISRYSAKNFFGSSRKR